MEFSYRYPGGRRQIKIALRVILLAISPRKTLCNSNIRANGCNKLHIAKARTYLLEWWNKKRQEAR
jgi:hypothetical protein